MRKQNMMQILLLILAITIGLFYAIKYGNKAKKDISEYEQTKKQTEQNPYSDMRNMAFSITPEQLGLNDIEKNYVYGIISEMDVNGGTATVITYKTGDTSIYLSSGGGFIGAGQHESVQKVVKKYVKNGQKYLEKASKINDTDLPKSGMASFNFLTKNGIYNISKSLNNLETGKSEFSNLFFELNEVISQIRLNNEQ